MRGGFSLAAVVLGVAAAAAGPPRTVFDLQPFRDTQSVTIRSSEGHEGTATLVNLNPAIGVWYVLTIAWNDGTPARSFHLENPRPQTQTLALDAKASSSGLVLADRSGRHACDLERAGTSGAVFEPVCDARLYLRNRTAGRHTRLETAAELLRDRIPGGESLLELGHRILGDANRETGTVGERGAPRQAWRSGPLPALVDPLAADRTVLSDNLGISLVSGTRALTPGAWYAVTGYPGVYASLMQPGMVAAEILRDGAKTVSALDGVESSALCYLVAFDLDRFDLGYAGGTDHPSVGWSAHMLSQMRDVSQPGPDGIGTIAPLVATGLLPTYDASRTVATFAGGFKRQHGAFLYGDLATRNRGTHYGFIENGVVLSTLQPGLSTLIVTADGRVDMKTWADGDNARLREIRHARQNGVAIVEYDEAARAVVPGRRVNAWGPGNWSGSADMKLRTIRGAAALQVNGRDRYLIYAVFSAATPSAMARVFQAYQCRYAMLLDMNALEHTYFALLQPEASGVRLDYLIKGMSQVDRVSGGKVVPRFVGCPDNRDFFYVMRRREDGR